MSSLSCIINHFTGPELNPEAEERFSVCETDDDVIYDDTGIEDEGNADELKLKQCALFMYLCSQSLESVQMFV